MSGPAATAAHPSVPPVLRRWVPVALAAVLWWVLYSVNRPFWDWVLFDVVGLDPASRVGESVHFFFYDVTKITLLLTGIIFVVTVLRSFMSVERTRALLGGRREGAGNAAAAGLGVVTPFCSCSAVPAFIGFVAAGVPLGVTMSFLIASPMVNEVAIVMLYGLFGWEITALYVATGLVLATLAGWIIGRLGLERWVEPFVFETKLRGKGIDPSVGLTWDDRLTMGREEVVTILRKIWPYLGRGRRGGALGPRPVDGRRQGPARPTLTPGRGCARSQASSMRCDPDRTRSRRSTSTDEVGWRIVRGERNSASAASGVSSTTT